MFFCHSKLANSTFSQVNRPHNLLISSSSSLPYPLPHHHHTPPLLFILPRHAPPLHVPPYLHAASSSPRPVLCRRSSNPCLRRPRPSHAISLRAAIVGPPLPTPHWHMRPSPCTASASPALEQTGCRPYGGPIGLRGTRAKLLLLASLLSPHFSQHNSRNFLNEGGRLVAIHV